VPALGKAEIFAVFSVFCCFFTQFTIDNIHNICNRTCITYIVTNRHMHPSMVTNPHTE
jgi:hypothetical protein